MDLKSKQNDGLESLIMTTFGEGLSGVLAYLLVDTHTFGRKYSLALGQSISSIFCLNSCLVGLESSLTLILFISIGRLFAKMCFSIIYSLTAEIYPTNYRMLGIGMTSATGRVASCIMPFVAIKLFYYNIKAPFFSFFLVGIIGFVSTLMLPCETRGRFLDFHSDDKMEELI